MKGMISAIGCLLVVFGLLVSSPSYAADDGSVANFTLKDMDGKTFNLSDYLGKKVILLNFWATWCIPCQHEFPHLEKLHTTYKDNDFLLVTINSDKPSTRSRVKPFIKRHRYTFMVLMDTDSQVTDRFNPKVSLPFSLIIDKNQRITYQHEGYQAGDETEIEKIIKKLIGKGDEGETP